MILFGCASSPNQNLNSLQKFNKICVNSSGKGRIEFLQNKYPFSYESEIVKAKNEFHLAFDFPIVGERKMILSLDPKVAAKKVNHSSMVRMLESSIGDRNDKEKILKAVEEFYLITSEFVKNKSLNKFPEDFEANEKDGHFVITRMQNDFEYQIDSYVPNENFYERVVMKISNRENRQNGTILTLFLVPEACEK